MLFMQRRVFVYHLGEVSICCANQASSHQFCMYQRCSQLCSLSKGNEYTHTLQVKQKAPIQHHNFLKTNKQKMRFIEAEKI